MSDTPIAILQRAANLRLTLNFTPPDALDVKASGSWPKSFADTLQIHKAQLLGLLQLPFVMVDSEILGETLLFCEDADTCDALVEFGAEERTIYTKDELRTLCEQNRVAPLTAAELRKIHEIKWAFASRIAADHRG